MTEDASLATAEKPIRKWYKTWWGILFLLIIWPFLLTFLIWKRNWNLWQRIGLIVFLWFVIFAIGNSGEKSKFSALRDGNKVGQQVENIIPPLSSSPTPISTTVPTLTIQPKQFSEDPIKYMEYSQKLQSFFDESSKEGTALLEGLEKWPNLTWDETVELAAATVVLENSYDSLLAIVPPEELVATHQKYLDSYLFIKDAMPILRSGLDNKDESLVEQATLKLKQSSKLTAEANQEIIDFAKSLSKE
ncbi:MAG: hypothetical protein Q8Q15_00595 [bacterium]|nr:hypothetical protein [bacterium]